MENNTIKILLQLFALLLAVPGAYLAFKRGAIDDIKKQMQNLKNNTGIGTKTIPILYQFISFLYLGKKKNWINIFNIDSKLYKKISSDKTSYLRAFIFFVFAFVFTLISVFIP